MKKVNKRARLTEGGKSVHKLAYESVSDLPPFSTEGQTLLWALIELIELSALSVIRFGCQGNCKRL